MRSSRTIVLTTFCGSLAACAHMNAARGPMAVDRPDFTEGTELLPLGVVQLEAGATTTRSTVDAGEAATINSYGEGLLRIGMARRLEVRVDLPSYNTVKYDALSSGGASDMGIGIKTPLLQHREAASRFMPAVTVLLGTSIPTGARQFKAETYEPEGILAASWELTERVGFAGNYGVTRATSAGKKYWETYGSGSLDLGINDRVGAFVELYGVRDYLDHRTQRFADGGLTLTVTPDLQLDAHYGRSIDGSREHAFGVGFATRW